MFVYQRVRCFFFFNRLCDHTPLVSVIAGEPCLFPVVSPQSTQLITASWVYTKLARRTGNKWLLGPKSEFLTFVSLVSKYVLPMNPWMLDELFQLFPWIESKAIYPLVIYTLGTGQFAMDSSTMYELMKIFPRKNGDYSYRMGPPSYKLVYKPL